MKHAQYFHLISPEVSYHVTYF